MGHQREVGYVSSNQYGGNGAILVSDAATTCHIMALRSTSSPVSSTDTTDCGSGGIRTHQRNGGVITNSSSDTRILGSLCHLDSTKNESCIRAMVSQHYAFHYAGS